MRFCGNCRIRCRSPHVSKGVTSSEPTKRIATKGARSAKIFLRFAHLVPIVEIDPFACLAPFCGKFSLWAVLDVSPLLTRGLLQKMSLGFGVYAFGFCGEEAVDVPDHAVRDVGGREDEQDVVGIKPHQHADGGDDQY